MNGFEAFKATGSSCAMTVFRELLFAAEKCWQYLGITFREYLGVYDRLILCLGILLAKRISIKMLSSTWLVMLTSPTGIID